MILLIVMLNLSRDIEYNAPTEAVYRSTLFTSLNIDQRAVYDRVMAAIADECPSVKMFYVDGPGGTSKTTLYTCLISAL